MSGRISLYVLRFPTPEWPPGYAGNTEGGHSLLWKGPARKITGNTSNFLFGIPFPGNCRVLPLGSEETVTAGSAERRREGEVTEDDLVRLEDEGWRALSTSGEAAREFYAASLDDTVVMLLPGGLVLDDRAAILEAMSGQPWESYELHDAQAFRPGPDTGVVTYRAFARRAGAEPYSALMSSVYVRRADGWKLVLHQQTPL